MSSIHKKNDDVVNLPKICIDGRYRAGRILVQKGQIQKAITIFASLLEESCTFYNSFDHFESCPAYYEYGNALFRYANRCKIQYDDDNKNNKESTDTNDSTSTTDAPTTCVSSNTATVSTTPKRTTTKQQEADEKQKKFKLQMREAAAAAAAQRRATSLALIKSCSNNNNNDSTSTDKIENVTKQDIDTSKPDSIVSSNITNEPSKIISTDNNDIILDGDKKKRAISSFDDTTTGSTSIIPVQVVSSSLSLVSSQTNTTTPINNVNDNTSANDENDSIYNEIMDDINLSLELMETSWAILDESQHELHQKESNVIDNYNEETIATIQLLPAIQYKEWIRQQIPRVLTGIGDVLSCLNRHPDAVDIYCRALQYRENDLQDNYSSNDDNEQQTNSGNKIVSSNNRITIEYINLRRLIVESNILIAEELLSCPLTTDIITSETHITLVTATNIVEYARGYYNKARDELQEVVVLMGQLIASSTSTVSSVSSVSSVVLSKKSITTGNTINISTIKEDICYVATMVMGVGMTLASIDENDTDTTKNDNNADTTGTKNGTGNVTKKLKR